MNQDGMGMRVRFNAVQAGEKFRATDGRRCRMKLLDYRMILASEVLPSGTCIFPTMGAVVIPIKPEGSADQSERAIAGWDYEVTGQVKKNANSPTRDRCSNTCCDSHTSFVCTAGE
jgi:hypothetical protein